MTESIHIHATLEEWFARDANRFSTESTSGFNNGVDQVIAALGDQVQLLGFGEALHGGEDILKFRNRLFQRLVEVHGYSAIAIESSFPRAWAVNEYVAGRGPATVEAVLEAGFSHGFGRLEANRDLLEWMRQYNSAPEHHVKLYFYGFDSPTEMTGSDSPRQALTFVLDYLTAMDDACGSKHHARITPLLGVDAAWENPAATFDPAQSVGLSPDAAALRIATEDLISELRLRGPEWAAKSGTMRFLEAVRHAEVARQLLNYHAVLARASDDRLVALLGLRDLLMADNLRYMVSHQQGRGKVFAFAHNSHMQRGKAQWQLGDHLNIWWPAGAHLQTVLGAAYAAIGSAVGVSEVHGIGEPEPGTLENRLTTGPDNACLIPTYQGRCVPAAAIAGLPVRSGSVKNSTYFSLTAQSFADFDYLLALDTTAYQRGGPSLQESGASLET